MANEVIYKVEGEPEFFFNYIVSTYQKIKKVNTFLNDLITDLEANILGFLDIGDFKDIDNDIVYESSVFRLNIKSSTSYSIPSDNRKVLIDYLEKDLVNNYPLIKQFTNIELKPSVSCKNFIKNVVEGKVSLEGEDSDKKNLIYDSVKISKSKPKFEVEEVNKI